MHKKESTNKVLVLVYKRDRLFVEYFVDVCFAEEAGRAGRADTKGVGAVGVCLVAGAAAQTGRGRTVAKERLAQGSRVEDGAGTKDGRHRGS